ncbi:YceD family protein [Salipiger mucosus]|uniref:DUF177 domain-containing protein n=1 Tax=Salipiger mucosus DSM 16094 TaxID=1123237 RepID=S9QVM7_9RHOB|nr:DUF177 domain-containing protein [Salipiger mucosus]EPX83638.1 hypothetical protein Salmuc_02246 [Salipiger mucosus DSM 16094]
MADRDDDTATHRLRVAALKAGRPTRFDYRPDDAARAALAERLELRGLRKARLAGEIAPEGRDGWRLKATLGATVTQSCVATLEPVSTRIDEPVERLYLPEAAFPSLDEGSETEVPEDDADPLPQVIDLRDVMTEALSLALPPYPRSPDAPEPEVAAEDDAPDAASERPNPFAQLAGLRDKLAEDDNGKE